MMALRDYDTMAHLALTKLPDLASEVVSYIVMCGLMASITDSLET